MKANKETLMAVKNYLKGQGGWGLDEVITYMTSDTGMLKLNNINISADECTVIWGVGENGDDVICDFQKFIVSYTNKFIEGVNNILDSFIDNDIDCYLYEEKHGWISTKENMPNPKEWCWVWFDYGNGQGYCEKMFLSTNGKWMKNTLSAIKDEYHECIIAWQPYYEPNPYVE